MKKVELTLKTDCGLLTYYFDVDDAETFRAWLVNNLFEPNGNVNQELADKGCSLAGVKYKGSEECLIKS